jgi:hypothetical protein
VPPLLGLSSGFAQVAARDPRTSAPILSGDAAIGRVRGFGVRPTYPQGRRAFVRNGCGAVHRRHAHARPRHQAGRLSGPPAGLASPRVAEAGAGAGDRQSRPGDDRGSPPLVGPERLELTGGRDPRRRWGGGSRCGQRRLSQRAGVFKPARAPDAAARGRRAVGHGGRSAGRRGSRSGRGAGPAISGSRSYMSTSNAAS